MNRTAYVVAFLHDGRVRHISCLSEWPCTVAAKLPAPALITQANGVDFEDARRNAMRQCVRMYPWTAGFFEREERPVPVPVQTAPGSWVRIHGRMYVADEQGRWVPR